MEGFRAVLSDFGDVGGREMAVQIIQQDDARVVQDD